MSSSASSNTNLVGLREDQLAAQPPAGRLIFVPGSDPDFTLCRVSLLSV